MLLTLTIALTLCSGRAAAQLSACNPIETEELQAALSQIERSVDPCGESDQVSEIVQTVRHCLNQVYRVCTSSENARNVFDRPVAEDGKELPRTITWNPGLRTELEGACDGDSSAPLLRDPTASLLHELVHAAHDCLGIDPGANELEAVRIENIYRRSVGLCQRLGYGDDYLPPESVRPCVHGQCSCSPLQQALYASPEANAEGVSAARGESPGPQEAPAAAGDQPAGVSGTSSRD